MSDDLDLPDDCWAEPDGELRVGDVIAAVPFPALVAEPAAEVYRHDDVPELFSVPVRFAYGLVLSVFAGYAVMAPITPAEVFDEAADFDRLADAARTSSVMIGLPELAGDGWWHGAVAHLFMVETLRVRTLEPKRVAAMNEAARAVVSERLLRAFAGRV
ncbi:MAG TPA: hypothetical protein VGW75_17745 [Solirubrobacteraceae bacterium]|jgi:hypothetical protein|nr:hypothetical protein [Solirubrobacteraceae bacterium]